VPPQHLRFEEGALRKPTCFPFAVAHEGIFLLLGHADLLILKRVLGQFHERVHGLFDK
jgi:hypothetical protein